MHVSRTNKALWLLLVLTVAVGLTMRMTAPSDLEEKTQYKTIAYTVDMVVNGEWILPRSIDGEPTTKPLLYNWLSVPAVLIVGEWHEWVLKFPSLLAGLATIVLCVWMTRWMLTERSGAGDIPELDAQVPSPHAVGLVAGILLFAGYPIYKQIYIARPEMLSIALVVASWVLATVLLHRASRGEKSSSCLLPAVGFWVCIALASLAKGPPAALGLIYLVLASKLVYGRWSLLNASGWWWGLPFVIGVVSAWLFAAYRIDPVHIRSVLLGEELADRVTEGGLLRIAADFWKMPAYFVSRYLPWSIVVVAGLFIIPFRSWMRHPLAPAILWMFLVVIFFSCSAGKIPRYISPAYPAAAAIASWVLLCALTKIRCTPIWLAVVGLAVTIGMSVYKWHFSTAAQTMYGEHYKVFANEVRTAIGDDPVLFLQERSRTIATLLGRTQHDRSDPEQITSGMWIIADHPRNGEPVIVSQPLESNGDGAIALYREP